MRKLLLLTLLMVAPMVCSAQLYAMRDSVQNGYNFWLYLPDGYKDMRTERMAKPNSNDIQEPLPIVLFLHGRSLSGTDLYTVRKYGTVDAIKRGRKVNAVVIAPQVNHGDWWRPERLLNIVDWVAKRYDVDTSRLYVLGMSLGGYGTLDFAATYPERTAAAIALCGGSTLKAATLGNLNKVPLWIMHGTADASVAVSASRSVKSAMEKVDPNTPRLRYDEWVGAGHSIYARTFYMDEAYEWLFKHRTTDKNRPVDKSVKIPTERFSNAYKGLPRGGIALTVYDPPTKATTKGRYLGEEVTVPAPKKEHKEAKEEKESKEHKENKSEKAKGGNAEKITSGDVKYHTVVEGETLSHIAVKYNTSVKKLCEWNNIEKDAIINIGKKLQVSEATVVEVEYVYHTVTAEDTSYWAIAKKYDTTVDAIMELNGLTEPKIYRVGEQMIVGKTTTTKSAPAKQTKSANKNKSEEVVYHTITEGDTLGHIAVKYHTTVNKLCELNNIEKTDILKLGKKLRVK